MGTVLSKTNASRNESRTNRHNFGGSQTRRIIKDMPPTMSPQNYSRKISVPLSLPSAKRTVTEIMEMDVFTNNASHGEVLSYMLTMLEDRMSAFDIPTATMFQFARDICVCYQSCPYHSWFHAFHVFRTVLTFLDTLPVADFLTDLDVLTLLVAAICHDVDHPGVPNQDLIDQQHPLALLYNDASVLENHHAALSFFIMKGNGKNILKNFDPEQAKLFRQNFIAVILATDLATHGQVLTQFKECMPKYSKESNAHRQHLMKMLLKSADIGIVIEKYDVFTHWAFQLQQEFFAKSPNQRDQFFTNQTKFMVKLAQPMWNTISQHLPQLQVYSDQLKTNTSDWVTTSKQYGVELDTGAL